MVQNTKEPGGGPFWIRERKEGEILQIIERSQINEDDPEQVDIFNRSSHFNPVDIVCTIKDHRGNIFDLKDFIEESRYFISKKTHENELIYALEHPGLWNGSMEKWISIYIEVPLSTFNPVKYINDLFSENHQPLKETSFTDIF